VAVVVVQAHHTQLVKHHYSQRFLVHRVVTVQLQAIRLVAVVVVLQQLAQQQ
jgi:hypothetical protein